MLAVYRAWRATSVVPMVNTRTAVGLRSLFALLHEIATTRRLLEPRRRMAEQRFRAVAPRAAQIAPKRAHEDLPVADQLRLPLVDLCATLRERRASPVELMQAVLTRIDETNGDLNAVVERARAAQVEWARTPIAMRGKYMLAMLEALVGMTDEIVPEIAWQMGRPVRYGGEEE